MVCSRFYKKLKNDCLEKREGGGIVRIMVGGSAAAAACPLRLPIHFRAIAHVRRSWSRRGGWSNPARRDRARRRVGMAVMPSAGIDSISKTDSMHPYYRAGGLACGTVRS
jgi:hypothetical protein